MAKKAAKKKTAKKKTTRKARKAPAKKTSEMLLVGSKVKAALREHNVNVSADSADALNDIVHWYIDQAVKRAGANGRKTVRPYDFMA